MNKKLLFLILILIIVLGVRFIVFKDTVPDFNTLKNTFTKTNTRAIAKPHTKNGVEIVKYPSGKVKMEITYKDGMRNGLFKWYSEDGKKHNEFYYVNNLQHGLCKWYRLPGMIEMEQHYEHGKMQGPGKAYNQKGVVIQEMNYQNNQYHGLNKWYWDDGTIRTEQEYQNGVGHGVGKWYYENGLLKTESMYANGKLEGVSKEYYEDGTLKVEKIYKDNKIKGDAKKYYPTGELEFLITYHHEDDTTTQEWFYKNGQPILKFNEKLNVYIELVEIYDEDEETLSQLKNIDEQNYIERMSGVLLATKEFERLEALARKYRDEKAMTTFGSWKLDYFYEGLGKGVSHFASVQRELYESHLNEWALAYPNSITQRVALVDAYIDFAWQVRGGSFSKDTADQAMINFSQYLEKAKHVLEQAEQLEEKDPHLYALWTVVLRGLSGSMDELKDVLDRAMALEPLYYRTYLNAAIFNLPRWGGYPGDVEGFANWVLDNSDPQVGFKHYARIADAVRVYVGHRDYARFKFTWEHIRRGYMELRERYPEGTYILNNFCWFAVNAKDRLTARRLFDEIGDEWNKHSIATWKTKENFNRWKKWAQQGRYSEKGVVPPQEYPGDKQIHKAIMDDDTARLSELVKNGANINVLNERGETPLIVAINNYKPLTAVALIGLGADVTIKNDKGQEALHLACQRGRIMIVQALLTQDVYVESEDEYGWVPLHYAAMGGYTLITKMLINHDPEDLNLNAYTLKRQTPLLIAAKHSHRGVVELLLSNPRTLINAHDYDLNTALHIAVRNNDKAIVLLLVENGADQNIKNSEGKTPLDIAKENGFDGVVRILSEQAQ